MNLVQISKLVEFKVSFQFLRVFRARNGEIDNVSNSTSLFVLERVLKNFQRSIISIQP